MDNTKTETQMAILAAAKDEFLEKGFRGASLRSIVRLAKVTTGAFYGYYDSKEQLFEELVSEPAEFIMNEFNRLQAEFRQLSPEQQKAAVGKISGEAMLNWIDYLLEHSDAFKLILKCSEGTKFENYIHIMTETEIRATHDFASVMSSSGRPLRAVDKSLEHILVSGMFSAYFEIVLHDIPSDKAREYVRQLNEFYTSGWTKIMGL